MSKPTLQPIESEIYRRAIIPNRSLIYYRLRQEGHTNQVFLPIRLDECTLVHEVTAGFPMKCYRVEKDVFHKEFVEITRKEADLAFWNAGLLARKPNDYDSLPITTANAVFSDPVNHPKHYTGHPSGVECIQIAEHWNFCRGNALKYLWRAGEKGDEIEDLKKAVWYIQREIQRLETRILTTP